MDGLEGSILMAQAALGVKNKAIDILCEELQCSRRENEDLFRALMQQASNSNLPAVAVAVAPHSALASAIRPQPTCAAALTGTAQPRHESDGRTSDPQSAAAEAEALKQQLAQALQQQAAQEAAMQQLRSELAASHQTIRALEAELQDTMDAAMQLWDTVQAGALSEGSASRPASLYQEQVSPLLLLPAASAEATDLDAVEVEGMASWRTPSASPDTLAPSAQSPAAAAAAVGPSADFTPRRAGIDAAAGAVGLTSDRLAAVDGSGDGHPGFFTPIELRVHSLASKLRTYMMRQPGMPTSVSPLSGRSAGSMHSPIRAKAVADAAAAADTDVAAAGGADQQ